MSPPEPSRWIPLAAIAAALAIWGALLAIGAWLRLSSADGATDPRKFWIVVASSGVFLGVWGIALLLRRRRQRRSREQPAE